MLYGNMHVEQDILKMAYNSPYARLQIPAT
jgi:hypothetical protein